MKIRPEYCEAIAEDIPCICGATKEGNDPVRGVCQARRNKPKPEPFLYLVLEDKITGEVVASVGAYR